jgi:serine/threonine protein kinase
LKALLGIEAYGFYLTLNRNMNSLSILIPCPPSLSCFSVICLVLARDLFNSSRSATDCGIECQQPNPRPYSYYASAPNDIWSLGVILVNLTCGRNPWKRASTEDSTFRAYLKDPEFLRTILPLSPELNVILRRIFECDPLKRITIPELRGLILECQRFTAPSRSPCVRQKSCYVDESPQFDNYRQFQPSHVESTDSQYSDSAISDTSLTDDDDSVSSLSSSSEYSADFSDGAITFVDPEYPRDFWGSHTHIPLTDVAEKSLVPSHAIGTYVTAF